MFTSRFTPLQVLGDAQVEFIHRYSLRILDEIGLIFRDARAVDILLGAGARRDPANGRIHIPEALSTRASGMWDPANGRIHIPEALVLSSLEKAPRQFEFHGRNPAKTV